MLSNCEAELTIDLKGERVKLVSFEADEVFGKPFVILLNVLSDPAEIDLLPCLGNEACVTVRQDSEVLRRFHGILTEGRFVSIGAGGYLHQLTLRPRSWLMDHNRDYRIFQEKTAVEIIKDVLDRNSQVATFNLQRTPAARTYCVQYGESDFNFISRLMEEEGIYYYYEHTDTDHKLVLCDAPGAHTDGDPEQMTYNPDLEGQEVYAPDTHLGFSNFVYKWEERVISGAEGKVTLRDFNFEQTKIVQVHSDSPKKHKADGLEVYAFPGEYPDSGAGTPLSRALLDALRARRQTFGGDSLTPALEYGKKFRLTEHPNDRYNKSYTLTRVHTSLFNSDYQTGKEEEESFCRFEVVTADSQWRSPLDTPRPVVRGPETAVITGPKEEKVEEGIYTDKYGRVKVRFHWDRSDSKGEEASCWMRVSQTGGLGNIILPRIGHEVIVDFLDGNPDRPLVVGRVFNSDHMPIYPLPDNKTRALWRTKRYGDTGDYGDAMELDTGKPGVNELRFEDKGGKEEVFLHAERDMNTRIRHNETHHVGLNREIKIGGDETKDVVKNETISIHKNSTLTVDQDNKVTIKGNKTVEIDQDETRNTKGNLKHDISGNRTMTVGGQEKSDVTGSSKMTAMSVEVEAQTGITLKCGGSKITIDPTGVKIEGMMISIEGQIQTEVKGLLTTVEASALLTLKGALTMIN